MSLFQCPLCGKYNSYARYDPRGFDNDIYGADVTGRGKGKGFSFSEKFSLLDDNHLIGLIAQRSRKILSFTEGVEPPLPGAMAKLQKINDDWATWRSEAQNTLAQKDAEITRLRGMHSSAVKTANSWREESSAQAAQIEELERFNNQWQAAYNKVNNASDAKDKTILNLRAENQKLRGKVNMYEEASVDEDSAVAAEMEELLERINDSSNTDYDNLSDAIDFLLEE